MVDATLQGLRVVDLTSSWSTALATVFLADNGAEVVMVEPPAGCALRSRPAFAYLARGKQSLAVDLTDPGSVDRLAPLLDRADVVFEGFRPGVAERLGVGYERVATANPGVVYASINGWGRLGPFAAHKGYEHLVMAKLGLFNTFRKISRRPGPSFVSVPYCSVGAAHAALHGTLAALYERESSGRGQRVDTSLAQGFASLDVWAWWIALLGVRYPEAFVPVALFTDDNEPNGHFVYQNLLAPTADGHWLLFAMNLPHLLRAGMEALGLGDVFDDPQWAGFPRLDDADKRMRMWEMMIAGVRAKTLAEWEALFAASKDLFAEEVRGGARVLDHPQLRHDDGVVDIADRRHGPVTQPGRVARRPGASNGVTAAAPALDEHRTDLLARAPAVTAPTPPTEAETTGLPLDGVTVLDLGVLFAGPYAATVLTDLGARVIKVEPLSGDPVRTMLPFPELGGAKVFQGKESIALDPHTPEGERVLHQLVQRADILLQSFRPDAARRLGVDAASIQAIDPDIVYVAAVAYGLDGPCAERPAFATTIAAATGFAQANISGIPDVDAATPLHVIKDLAIRLGFAGMSTNANPDAISAVTTASTMLAGLLCRRRSGSTTPVYTTMLSSSIQAVADFVVEAGTAPTADPDLYGLSALYRLYESSDGWIFLAAPQPDEWSALCIALAPYIELRADDRFSDEHGRTLHDSALADVLAGVFRGRPGAHWERELTSADVGCVVAGTDDPELTLMTQDFAREAGYVTDAVHPTFDEHPRVAPAMRFSRSTTRALGGVLCGQHTDSILRELGYDDEQITDLRRRSIVG
jgi:crotonobetainyl-CoA:carnitine CoA-transferase CaiB-like acyl-CoA transferase